MGIFKKSTVLYCPDCGMDIPLKVPRFGWHESRRVCFKCGCRFEIASYDGHATIFQLIQRCRQPSVSDENTEVGNPGYWKARHGDDWKQAHDKFMAEQEVWLAEHINRCTKRDISTKEVRDNGNKT